MSDRVDNSNLAARIASYELAYKMQSSAPEAVDVDHEPDYIKQMYGINQDRTEDFGKKCLLARRLVERGVRFIQIYSGGAHNDQNWDAHGDLKKNHDFHAGNTDKPIAGLLKDLKQRGLLDETLIIWGGEFGRTPMFQGKGGAGRDHHIKGFSIFLAGGGIKGGTVYGSTDEFGYAAEENPTAVHDLHATMLHLLGIDHKRLTYRFQGRDFRLTDVHGHIIDGILA